MRVYFVMNDYCLSEQLMSIDSGSMLLIGHGVGIDIDLVSELDGDGNVMKRLRDYSRRRELVIFCGIEARIHGRKYLSVLAMDRGRILGISDMTHCVSENRHCNLGSSYRAYKTTLGTVGIIVGDDMYFPETMRALESENIDCISALAGGISDKHSKSILETYSYLGGIPILSIVDGIAMATDEHGKCITMDAKSPAHVDMTLSRDMTLYNARRKSIYDNVYIEG